MRKNLLFLIGLIISSCTYAQVIVNVQLPATGIYLKQQLWGVSLINTSGQDFTVILEVLMTDASTNQPVLSGTSRYIPLKKGVTQINAAAASPITYNVLNAAYNVDANPSGFLPVGVFNVCYRIGKWNGDVYERMAEDCETIEIEPLSPPMLMLPFDEDEIETTRPLFTWIAPSPHSLFMNVLYDLTLVEILPTQHSTDAIQQNLPVFTRQNIGMTAEPYPAGYPELDSAKTYAWQITAKNNISPVAKSEVWTFKIKKSIPDTGRIINGDFYAKLKRDNDGAYIICKGILKYEYINELNDASIDVALFDISNSKKQIALDSAAYPVKFGQNLKQMDLSDVAGLINGHIYLLQLTNSKNEHWFLKFEYRKPD